MDAEAIAGGALSLALYELLRQRLIKEVIVASPAAGAEWSASVPAGVQWEILSIEAQLVTSAVVANRVSNLVVTDPNGVQAAHVNPVSVQAASATFRNAWLEGVTAGFTSQANRQTLPVPSKILPQGFSVASLTANIDVGDQYSGIVLMVREWSIAAVELNSETLGEALR